MANDASQVPRRPIPRYSVVELWVGLESALSNNAITILPPSDQPRTVTTSKDRISPRPTLFDLEGQS